MTRREFGELESAIIKLLDKYEQLNVEKTKQFLGGKDRYTTVLTVMKRLYEKKELKRVKVGRSFEYSLAKKSPNLGILNRIKRSLFSNSSLEMISYLIEGEKKLNRSDLQELEKLIKKARKKI